MQRHCGFKALMGKEVCQVLRIFHTSPNTCIESSQTKEITEHVVLTTTARLADLHQV